MTGRARYAANVASVLPSMGLDEIVTGLPYAVGLQMEAIALARGGIKFAASARPGQGFADIVGAPIGRGAGP